MDSIIRIVTGSSQATAVETGLDPVAGTQVMTSQETEGRMAHLEGLLEGLREAITGRRVAEPPEDYGAD